MVCDLASVGTVFAYAVYAIPNTVEVLNLAVASENVTTGNDVIVWSGKVIPDDSPLLSYAWR